MLNALARLESQGSGLRGDDRNRRIQETASRGFEELSRGLKSATNSLNEFARGLHTAMSSVRASLSTVIDPVRGSRVHGERRALRDPHYWRLRRRRFDYRDPESSELFKFDLMPLTSKPAAAVRAAAVRAAAVPAAAATATPASLAARAAAGAAAAATATPASLAARAAAGADYSSLSGRTLSTSEAAQLLGLTRNTVAGFARRKVFKGAVKREGGQEWLLPGESVADLMRRRGVAMPEPRGLPASAVPAPSSGPTSVGAAGQASASEQMVRAAERHTRVLSRSRMAWQGHTQTVHNSAEKLAAVGNVLTGVISGVLGIVGTAATLGSAATAGAAYTVQSASPDAYDTLTKSLVLLAAVVGKDLIPYATKLAFKFQEWANDWERIPSGNKSSAINTAVSVGTALSPLPALRFAGKLAYRGIGGPPNVQPEITTSDGTLVQRGGLTPGEKEINNVMRKFYWVLGMMPGGEAAGKFGRAALAERERNAEAASQKVMIVDEKDAKIVAGMNKALHGKGGGAGGDIEKVASTGDLSEDVRRINAGERRKKNKFDENMLGFVNRADPKFIPLENVWEQIQANLVRDDELTRTIKEIQQQSLEQLVKIADAVSGGSRLPPKNAWKADEGFF